MAIRRRRKTGRRNPLNYVLACPGFLASRRLGTGTGRVSLPVPVFGGLAATLFHSFFRAVRRDFFIGIRSKRRKVHNNRRSLDS